MPKDKTLPELLKEEVKLEKRWVEKYGTDDAVVARFRKARQEAIRDGIAEKDPVTEIYRLMNKVEEIEADNPHAHVLMAKAKLLIDTQMKMVNKVIGDVRSVELTVDGNAGGSEARGVSRAVEILGELAKRGLERDVTPLSEDRSVVSTQIPSREKGHGEGPQPGLVIREDEGDSE